MWKPPQRAKTKTRRTSFSDVHDLLCGLWEPSSCTTAGDADTSSRSPVMRNCCLPLSARWGMLRMDSLRTENMAPAATAPLVRTESDRLEVSLENFLDPGTTTSIFLEWTLATRITLHTERGEPLPVLPYTQTGVSHFLYYPAHRLG